MDGDICPLDEITELAEDHDAMVMVDDCHGEGVMGNRGAGIVDHFLFKAESTSKWAHFPKHLAFKEGFWPAVPKCVYMH